MIGIELYFFLVHVKCLFRILFHLPYPFFITGTNAVNVKPMGKKEEEQIAALAGNNTLVTVTRASKVDK